MNDYCFIAVAVVGSAVFPFAVHTTSDCNDSDLIWRYVQEELSIRYGFKNVRSPEPCEFEKYWYYPVRINLG